MSEILLIEDEAGIREAVSDFLRSREFHVREAESLAAARSQLLESRPALLILDLKLPDGDGLEILQDMRFGKLQRIPTIIVTARNEEAWRIRGLEAGADDYVVKPFSVHELWARIRAVLRRSGEIATEIRLADCRIDLDSLRISRGDEQDRLLPKEAELLSFLIRHPGRTFRREELLREVWGVDSDPTTRTVDSHIFTLRKKLEPNPAAPCFFITVRGKGYQFQSEGLSGN